MRGFGGIKQKQMKNSKLTKPQIKVVIKQLIHQLDGKKGINFFDLTNREINTLMNTDCVSFRTIEDSNVTIPMGLDLEKLKRFEQGIELIQRVERLI